MRTHRYRITIAGGLGEIGREAFKDFIIEPNGTNTWLIGDLDQAAPRRPRLRRPLESAEREANGVERVPEIVGQNSDKLLAQLGRFLRVQESPRPVSQRAPARPNGRQSAGRSS